VASRQMLKRVKGGLDGTGGSVTAASFWRRLFERPNRGATPYVGSLKERIWCGAGIQTTRSNREGAGIRPSPQPQMEPHYITCGMQTGERFGGGLHRGDGRDLDGEDRLIGWSFRVSVRM
jgi:hypothetical protein